MVDVQKWNDQIIDEFRQNDGIVATANFGDGLVLLHHTGARSDARRVNPLRALRLDENTWVVVASKQGADTNPDWYFNLLANPLTFIETPHHGKVTVSAGVLAGEALAQAWESFSTAYPVIQQYQDATTRVLPVIALRRRGVISPGA